MCLLTPAQTKTVQVSPSQFIYTLQLTNQLTNSLLLTGPLAWAKKFPEACAGQSNSPIDLNTGGEVRQTAKGWSLGTGWITDQSFKVKDEIVTCMYQSVCLSVPYIDL